LLATLSRLPVLMALGFGAAQAAPPVNTLPQGGQVVAGQASIGSSGARMDVTQSSQRAAIDWRSFNLGSNAQVNFKQPNSASVILNRVLDEQPSQIFGRISSNGQVFLSNPAGIYFSPTSSADVGALTATTHSISTADFMAGKTSFGRKGASGSVINAGKLTSNLGGYIALLAPEVRNDGVIIAQAGTVALAAGEMIELQFEGQRLTKLIVSKSEVAALVENRNAVFAPDGIILLSAQAAQALQGGVIKQSGSLVADSLISRGGRIVLEAAQTSLSTDSRISATGVQGGEVQIGRGSQTDTQGLSLKLSLDSGSSIDVSGHGGAPADSPLNSPWDAPFNLPADRLAQRPLLPATGGRILLEADHIALGPNSQLKANGPAGGGQVLVGGDWQGSNGVYQASTVTMAAGATIEASATQKGDGGKVVLWSDVHKNGSLTQAHGTILAKGGAEGGDGGRVETSGHSVDIDGFRVNTLGTLTASGTPGKAGLWLIDPYNYSIGSAQASTIGTALNTSSVTVTTTADNSSYGSDGNSGGNGSISVNSAITKTSGGRTALTLQAHDRVMVNAAISGSSGSPLDVVLWANYGNARTVGVSINAAINTFGGHLWAGGSSSSAGSQSWNGLTVGDGPSVGSSNGNGIAFDLSANISTDGGDVLLWAGNGNLGNGLGLRNNPVVNAGMGSIHILSNDLFNWNTENSTLTLTNTGQLTLSPAANTGWGTSRDWQGSFSGRAVSSLKCNA
jgi:filamentous hemagglutinin family protein